MTHALSDLERLFWFARVGQCAWQCSIDEVACLRTCFKSRSKNKHLDARACLATAQCKIHFCSTSNKTRSANNCAQCTSSSIERHHRRLNAGLVHWQSIFRSLLCLCLRCCIERCGDRDATAIQRIESISICGAQDGRLVQQKVTHHLGEIGATGRLLRNTRSCFWNLEFNKCLICVFAGH